MFKDILLVVLVSVVWKSVHSTYIINDNEDFDLISSSRLGSFHYTSPDLDSPLYHSHFSNDFHDYGDDQRISHLFTDDRLHQRSIENFPRLLDSGIHLNSPAPHLGVFPGLSQQYINQNNNNPNKNTLHIDNLNQEPVKFAVNEEKQEQNKQQGLYGIQKSTVKQEQSSYDQNSKTFQTEIEISDKPNYINNGFKPVSESKSTKFVIQDQQTISPDYGTIQVNSKNNSTDNLNYKILNTNFPIYVDGSYPTVYDQNQRSYFDSHVADNQEYSILPVQVNSGEIFNLHRLDGVNLPLTANGHVDLNHQNLHLIKLDGDILNQLSNGVVNGLGKLFKPNHGLLTNYDNIKDNDSNYGSPHHTELYPGKTSDDKTINVAQKSIDPYDSEDTGKSYDDAKTQDYSGTKMIVPILNLEQKSLDVGVKTVSDSKISYDSDSQSKDIQSSPAYPESQVKIEDVEQKTLNVDLKRKSDDSKYPTSDYGNSKTNTEQKSVEIGLKSSLGDSNAFGGAMEYDGIGSSKYPGLNKDNIEKKLEQKSVVEQNIYKDVKSKIQSTQKDITISSIRSLSKDDGDYKNENNPGLKKSGYESSSDIKLQNKPFAGATNPNLGNYGDSKPTSIYNDYNQTPRINSPSPPLGVPRYPFRSNSQPSSFGTRHFNSAPPVSPRGSVYRQRPSLENGSPPPRISYYLPRNLRPSNLGIGPSNTPNLGITRQFQITPGHSGYGSPRPPVYSEVRNTHTHDAAPKYQEPIPRTSPPRYPAFPPNQSNLSRGPPRLSNVGTTYRQNLGGTSNPSSVDYSSGIGAVEYPGIGEKPSGLESGSYARPQPSKTTQKPYNQEKVQSSIKDSDPKLPGEEYSGIGEFGSSPYPKSEVVGGRYPAKRPVKSSVKSESKATGKTKQSVNTEQKYLPITAVLSDSKDNAPAVKNDYGNGKSPNKKEPAKVEQQQEEDLEYEALLAGPGSQSNAVGSSGFGFNNPPAINVGYQSSPLGSSDNDQNLPPMPYEFEFDVEDDEHGSQYRQEKMDDNGFLTGRYGFRDPEGVFRQVEYEASKDGFKVNKIRTNEPGTDNQNPADVQYEVVNQR